MVSSKGVTGAVTLDIHVDPQNENRDWYLPTEMMSRKAHDLLDARRRVKMSLPRI